MACAVALARRREAWARVLDAVFMSPLMLPTLALGLALLVLFNVLGRGLSMTTLVIGHVAICAPYILRTTTASLLQLDPALLDSARSLGARPWFAFRTVTLPLVAPGVAAGAFIAFMASFDNVAISLFLSDARSEVLPIRMWHIIEANLDVRAAAASGVLIGAAVVLIIAAALYVPWQRMQQLTAQLNERAASAVATNVLAEHMERQAERLRSATTAPASLDTQELPVVIDGQAFAAPRIIGFPANLAKLALVQSTQRVRCVQLSATA